MKLITKEEAIKLVSFNNATTFKELLKGNLEELKILYPHISNIDVEFKNYIDNLIVPKDKELNNQFVRISRLYRFQSTINRIIYSISIAKKFNCKTAMDFGAGGGTECIAYAKSGLETTYVDRLDIKNADTIKKMFEHRKLNITMCDGDNLPNKKYDIISAFDVLEHLYDVEHYLAELLFRLNVNGFFIVYPDFDNIGYEGDHYEKNIVYRDIFEDMLESIGIIKFMKGPSVDVYRKEKYIESFSLRDLKIKLYSFTKIHCENMINKSLHTLSSQNSIKVKTNLTKTLRQFGSKLPIPQRMKRKAFTIYKKNFDETALDNLVDHYTVYRIVDFKIKQLKKEID